ncbi:MAG: tetraacyldisaccharide 4'-kinase [Ignavibacteriae bacterium]|nr:tetraacyldisaccharide 4'-kinase [Ignavibacteriota bacterium]
MKLLLPFSWLYAAIVGLRNKLFDGGVLRQEGVGVPVISVGNLTVGGTGKTPLVEYIAAYLLQKRIRVAVVSRGYKRKSKGTVAVSDGKSLLVSAEQSGDEPYQMAEKLREAIVVVGEKRVDAARLAVKEFGANVVLMDDGFQHRYLKRDLDIVVIDATKDITQDYVLPAGRLREPVAGLQRASLIAFSKFDETVVGQFDMDRKLERRFSGPTIRYRYRIKEVRRVHDDGLASVDVVRRMRLMAFSGIGTHGAFLHDLRKHGFAPLSDMRFSDHHPFSEGDVATLASFAKAMEADACITTEKDAVRLRAHRELLQSLVDEIPVFYLTIEVEVLEGKDQLHSLIDQCLGGFLNEHWNHGHSKQKD